MEQLKLLRSHFDQNDDDGNDFDQNNDDDDGYDHHCEYNNCDCRRQATQALW